jgi:hypothetical protein
MRAIHTSSLSYDDIYSEATHPMDLFLATGNTPINNLFQFTRQLMARGTWFTCIALSSMFLPPAALAFESLDALVSGRPLTFRCSNGFVFRLIPEKGSLQPGRFQNLSVRLLIGNREKILMGQQYAYNSVFEEQRIPGVRVWFGGKTGEVSISQALGREQVKELGRYCKPFKG